MNLIARLKEFDADLLLDLYREFLNSENRWDDSIYVNDEDFLNETFQSPADAVRATYYGNYRFSDNYARFNGYGNLESTDDFRDWIDIGELAEWLGNNPEMLRQYNLVKVCRYVYDASTGNLTTELV